jgi:hypothetical protein
MSYAADGEIRLRLNVFGRSYKRSDATRYNSGSEANTKACGARLDYDSKLQDCLKSEKPDRTGHGGPISTRRFTRYAARTIKQACAVLDEKYGRQIIFLTGTLPGSTRSSSKCLAAFSGYVFELLNQWLRDTAPGCDFVGVWEWQGRGALHLHYAIGHHSPETLEKLRGEFHDYWCGLLLRLSDKSGVDLFGRAGGGTWRDRLEIVQTNVQAVIKSVGRYLSKYLSKQGCKRSNATYFPPVSWWTCNRRLRKMVEEAARKCGSVTINASEAATMYEALLGTADGGSELTFEYRNSYRQSDRYSIMFGAPQSQKAVFRALVEQLREYSTQYEQAKRAASTFVRRAVDAEFTEALKGKPEWATRPLRFEEVAAFFGCIDSICPV